MEKKDQLKSAASIQGDGQEPRVDEKAHSTEKEKNQKMSIEQAESEPENQKPDDHKAGHSPGVDPEEEIGLVEQRSVDPTASEATPGEKTVEPPVSDESAPVAEESEAEERPVDPTASEATPGEKTVEPPVSDESVPVAEESKAEERPADPTASEATPGEKVEPAKAIESKPEEEDSDALTEKYSAMDRESLVSVLEELVSTGDVSYIRKHIGFIRLAYRKKLRDENMANYEQRLGRESSEEEEDLPKDSLADRYDAAQQVYKEKKTAFDKAQEEEMQMNLQVKEDILVELRKLIDSEEELKRTYDQFNALQDRWRGVGPVPRGAKSTLWNNYHFLVEKFFDKVNINKELKDLDLKKNMEAKTSLCEKAEELLLETSITKSFQQLQKLHEAWKEIGPVPQDKKEELWDRFKAATDKLNKRRQEHYDSLREEQNKNYAAKLVLCEKAEEVIATIPDTPRKWQVKTEQINELLKVWKTIGFAPKKVNNEVWNRFRNSLDNFFYNKKEYFRKFKDQQRENYNQKLNLCLQAEALKDSEDWRATTEALINLQQEWKKVGPVPAKFSDKIWKRFRQACDTFFQNKSDHFANIGQKQEDNLKRKQDLIKEVESYQYSEDNKQNLEVLKEFQRRWMEVGHVPIKQKDQTQQAFRKAIDHQFDVLNISKKAKTTLSFRTKIENLKSAPNADTIIQKERNFLNNKIKILESDIKVLENNIGFFASSKKADLLKAEFEDKIEKARNEIGLLREKVKILRDA